MGNTDGLYSEGSVPALRAVVSLNVTEIDAKLFSLRTQKLPKEMQLVL